MNSFGTGSSLTVGGRTYRIHRLESLEKRGFSVSRLPFSLRILLENLLRREDGFAVTADQIEALAQWDPRAEPSREIAFGPSRVLLQDFTGVPAVVDLAAMRDAMKRMGGEARRINPLFPAELVIDHSVQVDEFGTPSAFAANSARELERNRERYAFLKWGQSAFDNFKVVPPDTGIVHQVNLEFLARVVMDAPGGDGAQEAFPDTVVGTDSHTTMVNGLGVLGWGVGGIEAEAAMLGQPMSMLIPQVVGFRLEGELGRGATATDAVLTVTQMLRKKGVVGKFVEFHGPGLEGLTLADRATIANMAPEYGATCGLFPVDDASLAYLELTGRSRDHIALVESYMKEQGLFGGGRSEAAYSDTLSLDLGTVEPSLAGPRRPQDRVRLSDVKRSFRDALASMIPARSPSTGAGGAAPPGSATSGGGARSGRAEGPAGPVNNGAGPLSLGRAEAEGMPGIARASGALQPVAGVATSASLAHAGGEGGLESATAVKVQLGAETATLDHGSIVIAAITSCTNTSNPSVMLAAGLLAKKAVERGLRSRPWVKTSLAPGSKAVTDYLEVAGLSSYLDRLGFNLVGYGCTTCIGNSGPLPEAVSRAIEDGRLVAVAVLSGNRNFEGRINPEVRANYLCSPPLVVAYALAGRIDVDLKTEPLGSGRDGKPVYLEEIWPSQEEVKAAIRTAVRSEGFRKSYADVYAGDEKWRGLSVVKGDTYIWDPASTYVQEPPYFIALPAEPRPVQEIRGARALALFGDSITTDHISPAGSIKTASPAGAYLQARGVPPSEFNSYGSRRGNHEVMMRGTFANVRLKNLMVPGVEGGETVHLPGGERMTIFDAAMRYQGEGVPLVVLAGKEYGSGSSRDWAAKGPSLLGVRAVIAESFERIHRSNLVGMGIAPLEFVAGDSISSLGLTGREVYDIAGLEAGIESRFKEGRQVRVTARREDGSRVEFRATARLDTPQEILYYRHGGILQYVLRQLLAA